MLAVLGVSVAAWLVSVARRDVSIVDSLWSLMILLCALVYVGLAQDTGPRTVILIALLLIWAIRLSAAHYRAQPRRAGRPPLPGNSPEQ